SHQRFPRPARSTERTLQAPPATRAGSDAPPPLLPKAGKTLEPRRFWLRLVNRRNRRHVPTPLPSPGLPATGSPLGELGVLAPWRASRHATICKTMTRKPVLLLALCLSAAAQPPQPDAAAKQLEYTRAHYTKYD